MVTKTPSSPRDSDVWCFFVSFSFASPPFQRTNPNAKSINGLHIFHGERSHTIPKKTDRHFTTRHHQNNKRTCCLVVVVVVVLLLSSPHTNQPQLPLRVEYQRPHRLILNTTDKLSFLSLLSLPLKKFPFPLFLFFHHHQDRATTQPP